MFFKFNIYCVLKYVITECRGKEKGWFVYSQFYMSRGKCRSNLNSNEEEAYCYLLQKNV